MVFFEGGAEVQGLSNSVWGFAKARQQCMKKIF